MIASQLTPRAAPQYDPTDIEPYADSVGEDLGKIDLQACGRTRALRKGQGVCIRTDGKRAAFQDFAKTASVSAVQRTKRQEH